MDEQVVKRNKWSRKGFKSGFSTRFGDVLDVIPLDLLIGIRDARDLGRSERILMVAFALFSVTPPKNSKLVRGKPRLRREGEVQWQPINDWRPAEQSEKSGAIKFSNQDPCHPEIVKVHRGWVGNVFKATPEPLTIKDLMLLTGLSHQTIITVHKSLEKKGYVRVVVDDAKGNPELMEPTDPRRNELQRSGAPLRRALFIPGKMIDPSRRFMAHELWSVFASHAEGKRSVTDLASQLAVVLHGVDAYQSVETWAKEVGVQPRAMKRAIRRMLDSGVLYREEGRTKKGFQCMMWRLNLPVRHEIAQRDRRPSRSRGTPS